MATTRRLVLGASLAEAWALAARFAHARPPNKPFKLVMLGDSITAGLGLAPDQTIPARLQEGLVAKGFAALVINAGASGETSADVRGRVDFSAPGDAIGALVAVGANDMLQGLAPSELKENLIAIVEALTRRHIRAALLGMRASANLGLSYRHEFDAVYPGVARALRTPLYPFLLEGVALDPALNQADGIHPNARGAQLIANRLTPFAIGAFHLARARS